MTDKLLKCTTCNGRGYHNCECWPGDCICGHGDETCEECAGDGFIDPSFELDEVGDLRDQRASLVARGIDPNLDHLPSPETRVVSDA